ncbi:uncharacterized protein EV422DRAFT_296815 [Fimicolochytrium jonesii]|uniref:uncharacterized protein n=1 Tax=Fimicolochytrium jonesii TaxID=1396493 RepID=UPI0022FDCDAB|nr:uncharacterized protein EV422DRAFT_296815 [Fimicolochytrium jonesii]KAI8816335.1 hypothetical protein EV422DRAFT_296815 [Fimicolochytrium jonesii]
MYPANILKFLIPFFAFFATAQAYGPRYAEYQQRRPSAEFGYGRFKHAENYGQPMQVKKYRNYDQTRYADYSPSRSRGGMNRGRMYEGEDGSGMFYPYTTTPPAIQVVTPPVVGAPLTTGMGTAILPMGAGTLNPAVTTINKPVIPMVNPATGMTTMTAPVIWLVNPATGGTTMPVTPVMNPATGMTTVATTPITPVLTNPLTAMTTTTMTNKPATQMLMNLATTGMMTMMKRQTYLKCYRDNVLLIGPVVARKYCVARKMTAADVAQGMADMGMAM